jgi:hypothetical protein
MEISRVDTATPHMLHRRGGKFNLNIHDACQARSYCRVNKTFAIVQLSRVLGQQNLHRGCSVNSNQRAAIHCACIFFFPLSPFGITLCCPDVFSLCIHSISRPQSEVIFLTNFLRRGGGSSAAVMWRGVLRIKLSSQMSVKSCSH